jgi:hypothetical protein
MFRYASAVIRHVVLMRFTDPSDAPEAADRLRALAPQIDEIRSMEVLLDVVGSEVSWHLAMITTHVSLEALQGYQAHPVHQEFGAWVRPRLAARAAVDGEIPAAT